jgi:glycosyltransferase involved in cell wall biosynthesis
MIGIATQEIRAVRAAARVNGGRAALVERARHDLHLDDVDGARIEAVELRLHGLEVAHAEALRTSADERRAADDRHRQVSDGQQAVIDRLVADVGALANAARTFEESFASIDEQLAEAELAARIGPTTAWLGSVRLSADVRISVVVPTYDRCDYLERAINSVLAQEYPNWELVVVDDGSGDGTPAVLDRLAGSDERIVVATSAHLGACGARNAGLSVATGEIVCYLDDDNLMQPLWLKAVAWAFGRHPDLEVLYGAQVVEAMPGRDPDGPALPGLRFAPFDRRRLESGNYIDMGVIAHLRELPGARFDESQAALGDWDLILRLTRDRPALALPVVASLYSVSAPNRISEVADVVTSRAAVRRKLLRERPLRVLCYNSLFPLVPETYIPDEMKGLTDNGMVLAWCTDKPTASPVRVLEPTYTDLEKAVHEFEPDVLLLYWATFAAARLEAIERIGVPFAVRVHSFDFAAELVARVQAHPLCVGVWTYPHHAALVPGAHVLVPLLTTGAEHPDPPPERTVVLSASAGLPKKDWPTLVTAFAELASKGVDCRIVVGLTHLHGDEPTVIRELIEASGASVMLSVDVPHDQMVALLPRTALVVYSQIPGVEFGMPRSIVEGMEAGTSVVLPRRPESASVAGPGCRTYVDSDDIVRHALEVLAGGPEIETERARNREFARTHFADPALATAFAMELWQAVDVWRHAR